MDSKTTGNKEDAPNDCVIDDVAAVATDTVASSLPAFTLNPLLSSMLMMQSIDDAAAEEERGVGGIACGNLSERKHGGEEGTLDASLPASFFEGAGGDDAIALPSSSLPYHMPSMIRANTFAVEEGVMKAKEDIEHAYGNDRYGAAAVGGGGSGSNAGTHPNSSSSASNHGIDEQGAIYAPPLHQADTDDDHDTTAFVPFGAYTSSSSSRQEAQKSAVPPQQQQYYHHNDHDDVGIAPAVGGRGEGMPLPSPSSRSLSDSSSSSGSSSASSDDDDDDEGGDDARRKQQRLGNGGDAGNSTLSNDLPRKTTPRSFAPPPPLPPPPSFAAPPPPLYSSPSSSSVATSSFHPSMTTPHNPSSPPHALSSSPLSSYSPSTFYTAVMRAEATLKMLSRAREAVIKRLVAMALLEKTGVAVAPLLTTVNHNGVVVTETDREGAAPTTTPSASASSSALLGSSDGLSPTTPPPLINTPRLERFLSKSRVVKVRPHHLWSMRLFNCEADAAGEIRTVKEWVTAVLELMVDVLVISLLPPPCAASSPHPSSSLAREESACDGVLTSIHTTLQLWAGGDGDDGDEDGDKRGVGSMTFSLRHLANAAKVMAENSTASDSEGDFSTTCSDGDDDGTTAFSPSPHGNSGNRHGTPSLVGAVRRSTMVAAAAMRIRPIATQSLVPLTMGGYSYLAHEASLRRHLEASLEKAVKARAAAAPPTAAAHPMMMNTTTPSSSSSCSSAAAAAVINASANKWFTSSAPATARVTGHILRALLFDATTQLRIRAREMRRREKEERERGAKGGGNNASSATSLSAAEERRRKAMGGVSANAPVDLKALALKSLGVDNNDKAVPPPHCNVTKPIPKAGEDGASANTKRQHTASNNSATTTADSILSSMADGLALLASRAVARTVDPFAFLCEDPPLGAKRRRAEGDGHSNGDGNSTLLATGDQAPPNAAAEEETVGVDLTRLPPITLQQLKNAGGLAFCANVADQSNAPQKESPLTSNATNAPSGTNNNSNNTSIKLWNSLLEGPAIPMALLK